MDFNDVQSQLSDLPSSFKRFGPIYAGILNSFAAALARNTTSADGTITNLTFAQFSQPPIPVGQLTNTSLVVLNADDVAQWGWLDTFGKFFGIPRNVNESDPPYRQRIYGTLTAPHGSPLAIASFIFQILGINATVTEDFTNPSYRISFDQLLTEIQLAAVISTIKWVRPAGMPFLPLFQIRGGLFLRTINYFEVRRVTGSYLVTATVSVSSSIPPYTNNPKALLPTIYLTDPYITGSIAPQNTI